MRLRYILRSEGTVIQDRGAWALTTIFAVGNLASNDGSTWYCYAPHTAATANEPGVGADWEDYWQQWSARGAPGEPGGVMAWHGLYDAGHAYVANDGILSSDGRGFYALQATTGNAPPSYPTLANAYWSLFAERGASDHVSGTDQYLDHGGANEVSAANAKLVVTAKHTQGTDLGLDTGGTNPVTAAMLKLVFAKANRNTDQSIGAGAVTGIVANNQLVDTHNAYDPATGIFTVPVAGYYRVTTFWRLESRAWTAGNELSCPVLVDGNEEGKTYGTNMQATFTNIFHMGGSFVTDWLTVGQTIQPGIFSTPAVVIDGSSFAQFNTVTFERLAGA
ncbi:complement C1q domain-containing protein [Candidatus Pacearchaeota archaeon]|jgi:hypothetical protein|nr:complement C1q domain-containing protein [Candidatus Pacearchaeota archaeon]